MVETRMVEDPEFRNEVELTQALRNGMRELQRRGEIAPLLSPRWRFWTHPRAALAASLAAIALGVASFLFFQRLDRVEPQLRSETLRFLATRSTPAAADLRWTTGGQATRLTLQFDVGLEPASRYSLRIDRLGSGTALPLIEATAVLAASGEAELILEGVSFEPGDYRLRLSPLPAGSEAPAFEYRLRVEAP